MWQDLPLRLPKSHSGHYLNVFLFSQLGGGRGGRNKREKACSDVLEADCALNAWDLARKACQRLLEAFIKFHRSLGT